MSVSNIPMHGILQSKFLLLNRAVWTFSEGTGKQYFQNEYLAIDNPVHACIICSCCCFSFWLEAILSGNQKRFSCSRINMREVSLTLFTISRYRDKKLCYVKVFLFFLISNYCVENLKYVFLQNWSRTLSILLWFPREKCVY